MSSRPMKENRPSKAQAVLALAGTGLCLGAILCMSGDDAWENAGKNARLSLGSMLGLTPKSKKAKKSKYKSKTKAESTATMAKHVLEKKKKKKKKKKNERSGKNKRPPPPPPPRSRRPKRCSKSCRKPSDRVRGRSCIDGSKTS